MQQHKPLPIYKDPLYYTGLITLISSGVIIYSIFINKGYFNLVFPSTIIATFAGILTYFIWEKRCPHCKRPFIMKEDISKEKDLGIKDTPREYTSEIYKTKKGETIKEVKSKKMWPARIIQSFFSCKKCGYEKFGKPKRKNWENQDKWVEPAPKIIIVKENGDGMGSKNKKKRIPIPAKIKKEIFERADNACQNCGHEYALDIHHLDENPSNNSKNNLIVLCATCHRKIKGIPILALRNKALKPYRKSKTINIYK